MLFEYDRQMAIIPTVKVGTRETRKKINIIWVCRVGNLFHTADRKCFMPHYIPLFFYRVKYFFSKQKKQSLSQKKQLREGKQRFIIESPYVEG
jgi:hypothetical protein